MTYGLTISSRLRKGDIKNYFLKEDKRKNEKKK
jgi:hypothetical protein